MREAKFEGEIIIAGPDSPDVAQCPVCGGEVHKHNCRRMDGSVSYYYRHKRWMGQPGNLLREAS